MVFDHVLIILHLLLQIMGLTGLDNMKYNGMMSVSLVFILLGGGQCHCQEGMWIYSLRESIYNHNVIKKKHWSKGRENDSIVPT